MVFLTKKTVLEGNFVTWVHVFTITLANGIYSATEPVIHIDDRRRLLYVMWYDSANNLRFAVYDLNDGSQTYLSPAGSSYLAGSISVDIFQPGADMTSFGATANRQFYLAFAKPGGRDFEVWKNGALEFSGDLNLYEPGASIELEHMSREGKWLTFTFEDELIVLKGYAAEAETFPDDWGYRKSHVMNSASGAGSNYQVKITVHYGSGSDSGEDVYLAGKCKKTFDDVRFTDVNGALLDFYLEEKVYGDYAVFWVEVSEDLSSVNRTIYVYYGCSRAHPASDGEATFLFFEDFPGTAVDSAKWTETEESATYAQVTFNNYGRTQYNSASTSVWRDAYLTSVATHAIGRAVRFKAYKSHSGIIGNDRAVGGFANGHEPSPSNGAFYEWTHLDGAGNVWDWKASKAGSASGQTGTLTLGTIYFFEIRWSSGRIEFVRNETVQLTITDTSYIPDGPLNLVFSVGKGTGSDSGDVTFSFIAVRKYVCPEPTHGAWGSEEPL